MVDRTYGGRHISPSENGTQASKEIERREAAERERLRQQADSMLRLQQQTAEAEKKRNAERNARSNPQLSTSFPSQNTAKRPAIVGPATAQKTRSETLGASPRSVVSAVTALAIFYFGTKLIQSDAKVAISAVLAIAAAAIAARYYKFFTVLIIAMFVLAVVRS